jgi:hypothetical protein
MDLNLPIWFASENRQDMTGTTDSKKHETFALRTQETAKNSIFIEGKV